LNATIEKLSNDIAEFIKEKNEFLGTNGVAIGLSGGIDSALCAYLCVNALGSDKVLGVMIPERFSNPNDLEDGLLVANTLGISRKVHSITPLLESFGAYDHVKDWDWESIKQSYVGRAGPPPGDIEYHFQMRLRGRMYTLTHYARRLNYFICNTINLTEWYLGMFDPFGDLTGEIAPIFGLWKSEVFSMAKELGIPDKILRRAPSHGLTPIEITEEFELGLGHKDVDIVLKHVLFKGTLPDHIPDDRVEFIRNTIKNSEWKRNLPIMYSREYTPGGE